MHTQTHMAVHDFKRIMAPYVNNGALIKLLELQASVCSPD